jgi:hypothetical protein
MAKAGHTDTETVIKEIKGIILFLADIGSFIFIKMLENGACKVE